MIFFNFLEYILGLNNSIENSNIVFWMNPNFKIQNKWVVFVFNIYVDDYNIFYGS